MIFAFAMQMKLCIMVSLIQNKIMRQCTYYVLVPIAFRNQHRESLFVVLVHSLATRPQWLSPHMQCHLRSNALLMTELYIPSLVGVN